MKKLCLQLFTVRDFFTDADTIRNTLKKVKECGYDEVQTAGSGLITYPELAELIKEAGLKTVGTHYKFDIMKEDFETTIKEHKLLETTNCGIGGYGRLHNKEKIKTFIKEANEIADKLYEYGMKFTYHNHSHEFWKVDGDITGWDMLVDGLNPEKTSFVLDTCWVANAGADVRYWIEQLKGRIDILHLKDRGYVKDAEGNDVLDITEVGNGNIYWDGVIETAEKCGVKYYCVEQDRCFETGNPFDSIKKSADFLKQYIK